MVMASCSNSNDEYSAEQKKEIKVTAGITGLLTRVGQDATLLQDETFYNGSSFRLYLTNVTAPSVGYFTVTKNASDFTFDQTAYYPTNGSTVNAFALYPSTVSRDDERFTVQSDQSTAANYRASDLMYAYKADNSQTTGTINLNFSHCLTKVIVHVVGEDGTTILLPSLRERGWGRGFS